MKKITKFIKFTFFTTPKDAWELANQNSGKIGVLTALMMIIIVWLAMVGILQNMEERLITFETAKLANLKGFDPNVKLKKNTHYSDLTESLDSLGAGGAVVVHHYYAATQSLLQKWLRDVHGIEIAVQWFDNCYIKAVAKKPFKANTYRVEGFQSYEEALEIALQEALNLIP